MDRWLEERKEGREKGKEGRRVGGRMDRWTNG